MLLCLPSVTSAAGIVIGATPGTATIVAGASAAGIVVGGTSGIATTAAGTSAAGTTAGTISAGTPMSMSMTPAVTTVTPSGLPAAGAPKVPQPVTGTGPRRMTPALSPAAVEFVPTLPAMVSHPVVPTASSLVSGTVPSPSGTTRVSDPFNIRVSSSSTSVVLYEPSGVAGVSTGTGTVPGTSETVSSAEGVVETFTRLLKAQTDVIAAQAKAVAVQNLPSLTRYTGEGGDATNDGFDRWLECFRERATFAGWSAEEQLYQLKLHLDKTALDVFQMMPDSERETIDSAMAALKKRFKPADIEELRGLEFHYRLREEMYLFGLSIQKLGHKAFPTIVGKDFDCLIKGRFYPALLVKLQRKLGCPKPDKGFHDLLARARMFEEHEKQFVASAQTRNEVKKGSGDGSRKVPQYKPPDKQDPENLPGRTVN